MNRQEHIESLRDNSLRQAIAQGVVEQAEVSHLMEVGPDPKEAIKAREAQIAAAEAKRNAWQAANPTRGLSEYYAELNAEVRLQVVDDALPSAEDLDAVAAEQAVSEATDASR